MLTDCFLHNLLLPSYFFTHKRYYIFIQFKVFKNRVEIEDQISGFVKQDDVAIEYNMVKEIVVEFGYIYKFDFMARAKSRNAPSLPCPNLVNIIISFRNTGPIYSTGLGICFAT